LALRCIEVDTCRAQTAWPGTRRRRAGHGRGPVFRRWPDLAVTLRGPRGRHPRRRGDL